MEYRTLGLGRKRRVGRPRKRIVRRRGKGFGDFLSSGIAGLGSGVGKGLSGLFGNLFGGKRKRRVIRRPKRRVVRRRGRGISDVLGKINRVAKETGVVSNALNAFGLPSLASISGKLGYGRRHRGGNYRTIVW